MSRKRSFEVRVRNRAGEILTQHRSAESAEELYRQVAQDHLVALSVRENLLGRIAFIPRRSEIRKKEIRDLFFQLGTFLNAGVPIERLLKQIGGRVKNRRLTEILTDIHKGVRSGKRLSDLIGEYPSAFPAYVSASIRAGEESGALAKTLLDLSGLLDREIRLSESLFSSLIYPVILLATAILSVLLIVYFAIPRFAQIFADMGRDMPFLMKSLFFVSTHFWPTIIVVALVLGCAVAGILFVLQNDRLRRRIEARLITAPAVGDLIVTFQVSLYFRTLGMALGSSLAMDKGLDLANSTLTSRTIADVFHKALMDIRKGGRLTDALADVSWMPETVLSLLAVAEDSGRMEEMCIKIADLTGDDLDNRLKRIVALAEPVLILFVSVVVGGIIISLLYSLFSINF